MSAAGCRLVCPLCNHAVIGVGQVLRSIPSFARILGMATDELSQMAQRRQVRAFADRGTWRFRTQDIEELARQRGVRSSGDVTLGDAAAAPAAPAASDSVFDFNLGGESDQVEIGQEIISE